MLAQHQTIILSKWVEVTIVGLMDLFHSRDFEKISRRFRPILIHYLGLFGIPTTSRTSRVIKITVFFISSDIYRIKI